MMNAIQKKLNKSKIISSVKNFEFGKNTRKVEEGQALFLRCNSYISSPASIHFYTQLYYCSSSIPMSFEGITDLSWVFAMGTPLFGTFAS